MNTIKLISLVTIFAGLTSCGSPEVVSSTSVPTTNFYQSLSVSFNEATAKTSYIASFKERSVFGPSIQLELPAKVLVQGGTMRTVDSRDFAALGLLMPIPFLLLSTAGYFYTADGPADLQSEYKYSVTYPDSSSKEFLIKPMNAPTLVDLTPGQTIDQSRDFKVTFKQGLVSDDVSVVCYIAYDHPSSDKTSTYESAISENADEKNSSCLFSAHDLADAPSGSIKAIYTRTTVQSKAKDTNGFQDFEILSKRVAIAGK